MVKIKYIGDISPANIKVKTDFFSGLKTGDVIDIRDELVEHLLKNKNFVLDGKREEKQKKVEPENFDLDGDGDVDKDDYSLAAKVLASSRKKKKEE